MQHKLDLNQAGLDAWERIRAHFFDIKGDKLSFTARLARENRWSTAYALEVVEEYRRFCLLAVTAKHPITPSEDVDQVWHLHLTYSEDYWEEFCPNVLKVSFHHSPTKGGQTEGLKFHDWYQKTLDSYSQLFGEPPTSIWSSVQQRFSTVGDMVYINRTDEFVISKSLVKNIISFLVLGGAVLFVGTSAADTGEDTGSYLVLIMLLFGVFLLIAIVVSIIQRSNTNNDSSSGGCGGGCGGCGG